METQDFDSSASATSTWTVPRDITIRGAQISTGFANTGGNSGFYTLQLRYTTGNLGNPLYVSNASGSILTHVQGYVLTSSFGSGNASVDNLQIKLKKGQVITFVANSFLAGPTTGANHATLFYE